MKTPTRKPRARRAREAGPTLGQVGRELPAVEVTQRIVGVPADVFYLLRAFGAAEQESFYVVLVNVRNALIGEPIEIARGTVDGVQVHPRDVFRSAIRMNAAGMIVAHNHPSGDVTPSAMDVELTRRLRAAGEIVGIPVVDHVVFSSSAFRSIAETMGSEW